MLIQLRQSLKELGMDTLERRREILCLRFAKKCLKNQKSKNLFPLNTTKHEIIKRNKRKHAMRKIRTTRFEKSAIPFMTKLFNNEQSTKMKILQKS